jgi:polar amino acid transport system substrate-binding protein/glutamate/aspartate transport system substrate-binding protein
MTVLIRFCVAAVLAGAAACGLGAAAAGEAASALDRIRESGEITIGVRRDARPHSYIDADGHPAGYTVKVCDQVAQKLRGQLGLTQLLIRHEVVDAADRFQAVADGRIDLLCGAATITLTRRELVDFTIPTFADGASLLTAAGASEDFAQLAGKRIGVREGTTTEKALRASLKNFGMEAEIVPVGDHAEGLAGVENGTLAAYFGDQSILYALRDSSAGKDRLVVAGNTLTLELHGLALPLGDYRFRLALDRALSQMYREGRMADIWTETFPDANPGESIRYIHTFAPVLP